MIRTVHVDAECCANCKWPEISEETETEGFGVSSIVHRRNCWKDGVRCVRDLNVCEGFERYSGGGRGFFSAVEQP